MTIKVIPKGWGKFPALCYNFPTMSDVPEHLQAILDTLPNKPGCYLYKNSAGEIIYVGKAINLRNRVRSYFHASADLDGKTRQLVRTIAHIEWIVTASGPASCRTATSSGSETSPGGSRGLHPTTRTSTGSKTITPESASDR